MGWVRWLGQAGRCKRAQAARSGGRRGCRGDRGGLGGRPGSTQAVGCTRTVDKAHEGLQVLGPSEEVEDSDNGASPH